MPITEIERPHVRQAEAGAGLAPEARVVLLSAAGSERDDELMRLLRGPLNWAALLHLTVKERASAVLWRRITALGVTGLDDQFREYLRRYALIASFRQEYLEGRLAVALDVLREHGFDALLLKGAALGMTAYESFGDRPMGDVDVLLPAEQATAAHALLLRAGWQRAAPDDEEVFYGGHHHLTPLCDVRYADAVLELHHHLLPAWSPFALSTEEVWSKARSIEWRGRSVLVPSPEHMLLHLCIHYAWSQMAYLGTWRAFSDLHALMGRNAIDWDDFTEAAGRSRAGSCCYWTLRLAARYGGVAVPADVIEALRPRSAGRTAGLIERHLAANLLPGERACPSVRLLRWMWEAAIRPEQSGHGAVRPWHEAPRQRTPPPAGWARIQSHARRFGAWRRYLAAVLNG